MKNQHLDCEPGRWKTVETQEECRRRFNERTFQLTHGLANGALFSLEALVGVAKDAAKRPNDLYANAGDVKVTDKWGNIPMPDWPVEEVLNRIENAGAWVIIKHVETDPLYAAILNQFTEFVRDLNVRERQVPLSKPEMQIVITSPNRVTLFHIDYEVNFLVQIRGSKQVWVCDPNDRLAVSQQEIEGFYVGQQSAASYKPGVEERACQFELRPGTGVHIPTHAAHWVKNANNVSVSLSLNFELPSSIHRYPSIANYGLRRLGLKPKPPGQSFVSDCAKNVAGAVAWGGYNLWKQARRVSR